MNLYSDCDHYICHKYRNRDEWKENRINGIGGSDASALINMNPWKDCSTLWKEKKGILQSKDISDKPYVQYGINAEEMLRKLYAIDYLEHEVQYIDNVTLQSKQHPWMLCSPDGLLFEKETGRKGILEIKTTNILQPAQKEKWKNQIPMNYYIQILHGLLITGFDFVVLKAQLKNVWMSNENVTLTKHFTVTREEKQDDLEWLLKAEIDQWQRYFVNNEEPNTKLPEI